MKYSLIIFLIALWSCLETNAQKLIDTANNGWIPLDSTFEYIISKSGNEALGMYDLFGIELREVINKYDKKVSTIKNMDSSLREFVQTYVEKTIRRRLVNKFKKNSEGFIRADLSKEFSIPEVSVTVYLKNNFSRRDVDALIARLKKETMVGTVKYISKEDAKKRWTDQGEADFIELLEQNPIPASVEVTIKNKELTKKSLTDFKTKWQTTSHIIESISIPPLLIPNIDQLINNYYVFYFKT